MNAPVETVRPLALTPGRRALLLTVLICLAPVLIGGGLYAFGWRPAKTDNHGSLIQPPVPLPVAALGGSAADRANGKWLLVVAGDAPCDERCVALAERTRNIQVALNRDMGRLVRIVLAAPNEGLAALQARQPDLLVVPPPADWQHAMAAGPPLFQPRPKEVKQPARIEMMENEMAKLENPDQERWSSWV